MANFRQPIRIRKKPVPTARTAGTKISDLVRKINPRSNPATAIRHVVGRRAIRIAASDSATPWVTSWVYGQTQL